MNDPEEDLEDSGSSPSWRHVVGPLILAWGFYEFFSSSSQGGLGVLGQLVALFTLFAPGLLLTLRSGRDSPFLYSLLTGLTALAIPTLLLLGGVSTFFGGSNAVNAQITRFFQEMVQLAVSRIVVLGALGAALLSARRPRSA